MSSEMPDGASNVPEGGMLFRVQMECLYAGHRRQHLYTCTFNGGEKTWTQFLLDISTTLCTYTIFERSWEVQMLGWVYMELFPNPLRVFPVPFPISGFHIEPACAPRDIATVSLYTSEGGRKSRGRKFLFGLPASWIEGRTLSAYGAGRIWTRFSSLADIFSEENTTWPYTWGVFHRYVGGVKLLPFPTNYWPWSRFMVRRELVKHNHLARSHRLP